MKPVYDPRIEQFFDTLDALQCALEDCGPRPDLELFALLDGSHAVLEQAAQCWRPTTPRSGSVYFISAAGGPIKIGFSAQPSARLAALQAMNPTPLTLLGTIDGNITLERQIHGELSADRIRGEWFEPTERVLRRIADLLGFSLDELREGVAA